MAKFKLNEGRCVITHPGAQFAFAVHIKVKYGWTGDLDTTLLVLADTHEQARRAAAARLVVKEGISLPLDDNHFSETLVGAIERTPKSGHYSDQEWLNAGAPAEPEVSPEEFKRLWQGVCAAPRSDQYRVKAEDLYPGSAGAYKARKPSPGSPWAVVHRPGCPMDSDPAFYTPDTKCTCSEIGAAQRAKHSPSTGAFSRRPQELAPISDQHMALVNVCDCQRPYLDPADHAQDCPYRVEFGKP